MSAVKQLFLRAIAMLLAARLLVGLGPNVAWAAPETGISAATPAGEKARQTAPHIRSTVVLFRLDSLGLSSAIVERLAALTRAELERLAEKRPPTANDVARAIVAEPRLARCAGETECTALLGTKLGVRWVIAGNVGGLGESHVINLKLVESSTAQEVRRIQVPLDGRADELIEAVRVALVTLVEPNEVRGSIALLCDVRGAEVRVDGKLVGKTPLPRGLITNLDARPSAPLPGAQPYRMHTLRISAPGYTDYVNPNVLVRFQKDTEVVVSMQPLAVETAPVVHKNRVVGPRWWVVAGIGVGAILTGVLVGRYLSRSNVVNCDDAGGTCP